MKRFFLTICAVMMTVVAFGQGLNTKADEIIGTYLTDRGGSKSKVRVTKQADGTYDARVIWVENAYDANGNKRKDEKNPDKALRNVDVDNILLVEGLRYDAATKMWGGAKIYDPTKGIKVNATAEFETKDKLKLRGTIMGLGVTLYWVRIAE